MLRSAGLWRAVLRRSLADWPVVLAAWLLLACAATLLVAGILYGDAVALGGLRRAVLDAPPADRTVDVRMFAAPAVLPDLDGAVSARLRATLGDTGGEVGTVLRSDPFALAGAPTDAKDLELFASYSGIDRHAALVTGRWADPGRTPLEATISEGTARSLDLSAGDRVTLVSRRSADRRVDVTVVGTWRPEAEDAYWRGDQLELTGEQSTGTFTTHGPFVIAPGDLLARTVTGDVDVEWRAMPAVDGLRVDGLADLGASISSLRPAIAQVLPAAHEFRVSSSLPALLDEVGRSTLVARSGVLLLTLEFAILAGYAIVLVAGVLVDRRRAEIALLRARGGSATHVIAMAVAEGVLLATTAAVAAPFLAIGIVRALGVVGPLAAAGIVPDVTLGPVAVSVAVLAAVACVLSLSLPTLTSVANPAGVRAAQARQSGRTLPQRLGIDVALVVVAAIALWQLRLYGAPITRNARGILGVDPLLVAAPAIGLFAGAVLAIRVVPRLGELVERGLGGRRGAVPALGGRQLARRPLRYTRSALLLMLALALGTFALAQSATWTRSQADQASYRAVADVRAVVSDYPDLPSWAVGPAYRSVPGVSSAMPVVRRSIDVGRALRDGTILGLEPRRAGDIVHPPGDDVAAPALDRLARDAAVAPTGAALPDGTARLAVTIDADLRADPSGGDSMPEGWRGLDVAVVVEDGDGWFHRLPAGGAAFSGAGQRLEVAMHEEVDGREIVPLGPLHLVAIEVGIDGPANVATIGTVDVVAVESAAASGGGWTPVALDPGTGGWSWLRADDAGSRPYSAPAGHPLRIRLGGPGGALFGNPTTPGPVYRFWARPAVPSALPAIAGTSFLRMTGARVGDRLAASSLGRPIELEIVGSVDRYPPLDPAAPFVIVDEHLLAVGAFAEDGTTIGAQEWWMATAAGQEAAVVRALDGAAYAAADVIGRRELNRSLASDPVALGVVGALGIGALSAMIFAAIGFLVSAVASTSERLGEFALLRALGLSGRELSAWVALENVFLLTVGLVTGSVLGLLLAWLVLPFATLTATGAAPVPPAVVVIPWAAFVPVYAVAIALLAVTLALVIRQLRSVGISGVLRARDG